MDLKSSMQAISNGGSADMARLLLKAMREKQIKDKEEERRECWGSCVTALLPVLYSHCTATHHWVLMLLLLLLGIVQHIEQ